MAGEALYEALTNLGNLYTQRLREDRVRQQRQEDLQGERDFVKAEREERRKWATQEADEKAARDREQALWAQEQTRKMEAQKLGLSEDAGWDEITKAKDSRGIATKVEESVVAETAKAADALEQGAAAAHNVITLNRDLVAAAAAKDQQLAAQLDGTVPQAAQVWKANKELFEKAKNMPPGQERAALFRQITEGMSGGQSVLGGPSPAEGVLYTVDPKTKTATPIIQNLERIFADPSSANDYALRLGQISGKAIDDRAKSVAFMAMKEAQGGRLDTVTAAKYADAVENLSKLGWAMGVPAEQQPLFHRYKQGMDLIRAKHPDAAKMLDRGDTFASRLENAFSPVVDLGTPPPDTSGIGDQISYRDFVSQNPQSMAARSDRRPEAGFSPDTPFDQILAKKQKDAALNSLDSEIKGYETDLMNMQNRITPENANTPSTPAWAQLGVNPAVTSSMITPVTPPSAAMNPPTWAQSYQQTQEKLNAARQKRKSWVEQAMSSGPGTP